MMRKLALFALVLVLLEGVASAALTSYTNITDPTVTSPTGGAKSFVFRPSNKVGLFYIADTANAQNYGIVAKHDSGNRTYFTSNMATVIYYKEDGTVKDGVPLSTTNIPDASSLTAGYSTTPNATGWNGL
jgi:hypothetical protein